MKRLIVFLATCALAFTAFASSTLPQLGFPVSYTSGGATVTFVGSACTTNAFAASVNISVPNTLAAGGGVIIWTVTPSGSTSNLTFTDTGGNTWRSGASNYDITETYTGYTNIERFYSEYLTNAISAGGHITVSLSNGTNEGWLLCAMYASVMASSSAFDVGGYINNTYGSTNYTSAASGTGSATTTNATDLCVGALLGANSITSATWAASYAALHFENPSSPSSFVALAWIATTATGLQRGNATLSGSDNSNGQIACYKQ